MVIAGLSLTAREGQEAKTFLYNLRGQKSLKCLFLLAEEHTLITTVYDLHNSFQFHIIMDFDDHVGFDTFQSEKCIFYCSLKVLAF